MAWTDGQTQKIERGMSPLARRLTDLSLAMIIPWPDGFPKYWLSPDGSNDELRMNEIAEADERLPWEL